MTGLMAEGLMEGQVEVVAKARAERAETQELHQRALGLEPGRRALRPPWVNSKHDVTENVEASPN